MLTESRVWLRAAALWLAVCAAGSAVLLIRHAFLGIGVAGHHQMTVQAMQQTLLLQPLGPSLWTVYIAVGLSSAMLMGFAGLCSWGAAGIPDPPARRRYALAATIFWTITFGVVAALAPVALPLVAALGAVPPHAIATLLATAEAADR